MVKLMYFAQPAETLDQTSEQVTLPATVDNVKSLIGWLVRREDACWKALAEHSTHTKAQRGQRHKGVKS